jgi:hypothetical protein
LTKWTRLFSDELTRALRLANNQHPYVDAQFDNFAAGLYDADPTSFDPAVVIKKQVDSLAGKLTDTRSKALLKNMFPAPVQSVRRLWQKGL